MDGILEARIKFDEISIKQHWGKFPELEGLFTKMSSVEKWVLDYDADIEIRIGNWVESTDFTKVDLRHSYPSLLCVLAFISVGPSMYLLQELDKKIPNLIGTLSTHAKNLMDDELYGRPAMILLERLSASHTQIALSMIFSSSRLALVYKAIENVSNKRGDAF